MSINRRELMIAMLGAPALMMGCSKRSPLPPEGELFGQSLGIGHRLRDGFRPRPSNDQWQDVQVAIVGAGAAGLSAAWRLRQAGCEDFVVLELEHESGGTSRFGQSTLTSYPWGAHYVPVPMPANDRLIRLLSEMGVVESIADDGAPVIAEQFLCRDPEERLFVQGQWIEGLYPTIGASADDLAQLAAFRREIDRWVEWRDASGHAAFAIPTRLSTTDPTVLEFDRISMSDWMRRQGWNSSRLRWFVDYCCRDDFGLSTEHTSAWAGLLYFVARLNASGAEPQPFITWPEGNGRIISHLSQSAGDRLRTGMAVTQITPVSSKDGDRVDLVCVNTRTQAITGIKARHVIYALPQFMTTRLIDGFVERTGRQTNEFEYGSWIVSNLHLSGRPRERSFPLCWDNVIYDSRSLGYVVATHQTGLDHGPTILTWYFSYSESDARGLREQLLKASWSDLAEVVLTDLERPHPDIRSLTTRLDIFRWGHAMIRPRPGFINSIQRHEAQKPDGRIHFANTDLSGIALFEEAFDHGYRAADEVIRAIAVA
jgi:protoporphyrinogen oxidase